MDLINWEYLKCKSNGVTIPCPSLSSWVHVGALGFPNWAFQVHANFLMRILTRSKTYIFIEIFIEYVPSKS